MRIIFLPTMALLSSTLLAACSQAAAAPTETPGVSLTVPYTVDLHPADFARVVDNVYFPLIPGATYVYEAETEEGVERTELEILADRREVMGIMATIVHDTVYLEGELLEDTYDWYAQDLNGDVWYLGEDVTNYENGQIRDKAGSWQGGVDGALPGIIMLGDPAAHIGETYRQEYYAGHAEDMADLVSVDENVVVPFGSFGDVVKTLDYTPLEPDLREQKYYASGIGPIKTVNLTTGEEDVLVQFVHP